MSTISHVRILNGALDEHDGQIVLRGAIDPETLHFLLVDDYQREVQPVTTLSKIMKGYEHGSSVPDIDLGMRGNKKVFREGIYTLYDPVYIIDGQQRTAAAKLFQQRGGTPHLGATIHFGTTKEWERKQFKILNADRVRVSSNILFRNDKDVSTAVKMLYDLTESDREFALHQRVSWDQHKKRSQLLTAMMVGKVACLLHSHVTGLVSSASSAEDLTLKLGNVYELVGRNTLRANIKTFFDILDECWGLKRIVYTERAIFTKATFLLTFARLISNHAVFWREDDRKLLVEADLKRKLSSFPMAEPTVVQLASAGSRVDVLLYKLIIDHLNKGKRTQHLRERHILTEENAGGDVVGSAETNGNGNHE